MLPTFPPQSLFNVVSSAGNGLLQNIKQLAPSFPPSLDSDGPSSGSPPPTLLKIAAPSLHLPFCLLCFFSLPSTYHYAIYYVFYLFVLCLLPLKCKLLKGGISTAIWSEGAAVKCLWGAESGLQSPGHGDASCSKDTAGFTRPGSTRAFHSGGTKQAWAVVFICGHLG